MREQEQEKKLGFEQISFLKISGKREEILQISKGRKRNFATGTFPKIVPYRKSIQFCTGMNFEARSTTINVVHTGTIFEVAEMDFNAEKYII